MSISALSLETRHGRPSCCVVLLRHEVALDPGPGHPDKLRHLCGVVYLGGDAGDDVDGHGPLLLRGDSGDKLL